MGSRSSPLVVDRVDGGVDSGEDLPESRRSRAEPPRTPDALRAEAELDELLASIERRAGSPLPAAWASASPVEMERARDLSRVARPRPPRWQQDLDSADPVRGPSPTQRTAIENLANASVGELRVRWDETRGVPAELDAIGYVDRTEGDPEALWRSFRARRWDDLAELFALGTADDLRVASVVDDLPELALVMLQRWHGGAIVLPDHLVVAVGKPDSLLGSGVLWRVHGTISRIPVGLDAPVPNASPEELASVLGEPVLRSRQFIHCAGNVCGRHVEATTPNGTTIAFDARDPTRRVRGPEAHHTGPIFIGSYPPGATTLTPVRYRGANLVDSMYNHIGYTSFADGTYSATGSEPWQIDHIGAMPTSTNWPWGRVDSRYPFDWNALTYQPRSWTPSSQPARDFSNPDAWPPGSGWFEHTSEIVYGWLTYWQHLFRNVLYLPTPATVSYRIVSAGVSGTGLAGCTGPTVNVGPPGSGQPTWGLINCGARLGDDVQSDVAKDLAAIAHEFSHTAQSCAASGQQGAFCENKNPGPEESRPNDPSLWRRSIWNASIENFARMSALILAEYRDQDGSGCPGTNGCDTNVGRWFPTFTYSGYASTTDWFGSATQDSPPGDCNDGFTCPTGYSCLADTDESPIAPGAGICLRNCAVHEDCQLGQYCQSFPPDDDPVVPPGQAICKDNGYVNHLFVNTGVRMAVEEGWRVPLKKYYLAYYGNSGNATRDFASGPDNWYQHLLNADAITRYETSKAIMSVVDEPGVDIRDDYTRHRRHALPVTVVNETGSHVWWGRGVDEWSSFDDEWDADWVLFYGLGGSSYIITAQPETVGGITSPVNLGIEVRRWNTATTVIASGHGPAGQSAEVNTGPLPTSGWYAVAFFNRLLNTGIWHGMIKIAPGSDDHSGYYGSGYPMFSGHSIAAKATPSDGDWFRIYVPQATGTLTAVSSSSALQVRLWDSTSIKASGLGSAAAPVTSAGWWSWEIRNPTTSTISYTTSGTISCASGSTPCDELTGTSPVPLNVQPMRAAGRLRAFIPGVVAPSARYQVTLSQHQHASFALVHNTRHCKFEMDLIGPSSMAWFQNQPIWTWRGERLSPGSSNGPNGWDRSPGGHVVAPVAGDYVLQIRSRTLSMDCGYTLFAATSDLYGEDMPAW